MKFLPKINLKTKLKDASSGFADVLGSVVQIGFPGAGSAICFAVGKVVVGLILACVTLAVIMRLVWRRKQADQVRHLALLPAWAQIAAALTALIGSATLVEMTKLPVRFDQPNFAMSNWLVVIVAIVLLNSLCRSLFKTWLSRKSTSSSLVKKQ